MSEIKSTAPAHEKLNSDYFFATLVVLIFLLPSDEESSGFAVERRDYENLYSGTPESVSFLGMRRDVGVGVPDDP